jgi:hypothetical protein
VDVEGKSGICLEAPPGRRLESMDELRVYKGQDVVGCAVRTSTAIPPQSHSALHATAKLLVVEKAGISDLTILACYVYILPWTMLFMSLLLNIVSSRSQAFYFMKLLCNVDGRCGGTMIYHQPYPDLPNIKIQYVTWRLLAAQVR